MRAAFPWILSLALGYCAVGCAADEDSGEGNAAGSGGSSSGGGNTGGSSADRCHDGCIATLAANCQVSPKDQATCESDCHSFEIGNCATEYKAFQDCAIGKPITCDAVVGFPVVADCGTEQGVFIACAEK